MVRDYERLALPYAEAFEYFEADLSEYSGARLLFYINEEYLWRSEPYRFYNEAIFLATRIGNSGISVSGLGDGFSTGLDRKSTRLNSSHVAISYAVFCLKKKNSF